MKIRSFLGLATKSSGPRCGRIIVEVSEREERASVLITSRDIAVKVKAKRMGIQILRRRPMYEIRWKA